MHPGSSSRALRAQFAVLVIVNLGNVFAYLFQVLLARSMSPADYGAFNALFSLAIVLAAPSTVLQFIYSKQAILLSTEGTGVLKQLLYRGIVSTMAVAFGATLLGVLLGSPLRQFLSVGSNIEVILMMAFVGASVMLPMVAGVVQGLRRYIAFSISVSSVPLARLVAGVFLVAWGGYGVGGALWACIASTLVGVFLALFALRDLLPEQRARLPGGTVRTMRLDSWPMAVSSLLMLALVNLDVVLVRHYCSPGDSGLYATASILGRIAFLLPGVLTNVLFPETIRARAAEAQYSVLAANLSATSLLAGGVALVFYVWPNIILSFLMGTQYSSAAPLLQTVSVAMAFLAVAHALFTYLLARGDYRFIVSFVVTLVAFLGLVFIWHDSALTIARLLVASAAVICLVGVGFTLRPRQQTASAL